MADRLVVRGAREHNLQDVSLDLPRDRLIVFTGLSGLGQVLPGLRHHLRRGPAPLRRVPLGLRPPVPGPDGQARRRLHRGAVPGHLHRPEVGVPQPPLDGGDGHRGLRLPPPPLRPHRQAPLPQLRPAGGPPDPPADRGPGPGHARGHPLPGPGPGGPGPQGGVQRPARRPGQAGLRPGPGRRRAPSSWPTGPSSTWPATRSTPSRWWSTAWSAGTTSAGGSPSRSRPPWRLAEGVAEVVVVGRRRHRARRPSPSPSTWPAPTAASASRSPPPATSPSTRPTGPARPAPASAPGSRSTPSWWCPIRPLSLAEGALAPWSGARSEYFTGLHGRAWPSSAASPSTPRGRRSRPRTTEAGPLRGRAASTVHVKYSNRYGRQRSFHTLVRGHRPVAAAPPRRGRVGLSCASNRGLHARGALPRVRGRPPQARVAGRDRRGLQHLRAVQPVHRQGGRRRGRRSSCPTATT